MERQERIENIPKWEKMDKDVLANIFKKLDVGDVIMGASRVCITWFLAAHNKTIWNTIKLNDHDSIVTSNPHVPWVNNNYFYNNSGEKQRYQLREILIEINKFSRAAPVEFFFNVNSYVIDEDLAIISNGLPNIRKLALPKQRIRNLYLFASSFSKWKNLQTLIIGKFAKGDELRHRFEAIAENCRNLTNLKFTYTLDQELANIIVGKLPNLQTLSVRCTYVFTDAVKSLIIGHHSLKRLNLSHCVFKKGSDNGIMTVSSGMLHEDEYVILSIQKLETLKLCRSSDCTVCMDVWWKHTALSQYVASESVFSHFWDNQWGTDEFME